RRSTNVRLWFDYRAPSRKFEDELTPAGRGKAQRLMGVWFHYFTLTHRGIKSTYRWLYNGRTLPIIF
ncbi:MAG: hypothetical protein O7D30_13125, partial [Rickettsia endosymbiont of Ixodes persulcatus]|nr:hypothetical protein [Rickettsia endosymbiont of Ixodes persulcatus]